MSFQKLNINLEFRLNIKQSRDHKNFKSIAPAELTLLSNVYSWFVVCYFPMRPSNANWWPRTPVFVGGAAHTSKSEEKDP